MILSRPGGNAGSRHDDTTTPTTGDIVAPREGGEAASAHRWDRELRLSVNRPEPGAVVVQMSGEIDLAAVARLSELIQQRLTAAYLNVIVLDLAAVSFCDSSGLELLLEAQHSAEHRGITLYVVPAGGAVHRLLEITGLTGRFSWCGSAAEAVARSRH